MTEGSQALNSMGSSTTLGPSYPIPEPVDLSGPRCYDDSNPDGDFTHMLSRFWG